MISGRAFTAGIRASTSQLDVLPSSEIVTLMAQRAATAGIALCRQMPKRLESKVFLQQRYALFCGRNHALFGKTDIRLEDLLSENFVSFASDSLGDSLSPLTIFRDQRGFAGRIVATSSHHDEVKRLLIAGFGIGCLPEHSVATDLADGRLWRLPPARASARSIFICCGIGTRNGHRPRPYS